MNFRIILFKKNSVGILIGPAFNLYIKISRIKFYIKFFFWEQDMNFNLFRFNLVSFTSFFQGFKNIDPEPIF
jgi:hypothetical protein